MMQSPPDPIDVLDFQFQTFTRLKIFENDHNQIFPTQCNLIASASQYGLIFVGTIDSNFEAIQLNSLDGYNRKEGFKRDYPRRKIPLPSPPKHLSVNCDSSLLAVVIEKDTCPVALIYSIPTFFQTNIQIIQQIRLSSTPQVYATETNWNPTLPRIFTVCKSDGSLGNYELKIPGIEINEIPTASSAACFCWSPKGKQIAVGSKDGKITQYKPDLKAVKVINPPQFDEPTTLISLQWISNYQFIGVFQPINPENQASLIVIDAPKSGEIKYTNYYDVCFSNGTVRPPQFYMLQIQNQLNILMVASSNSIEVAVLGFEQDSWKPWTISDAGRAELPLNPDKKENLPIGLTLDFSGRQNIPWKDSVLPPAPRLVILSNFGVLCCFNLLNLKPGAKGICLEMNSIGNNSEFFKIPAEISETTTSPGQVPPTPTSASLLPTLLSNQGVTSSELLKIPGKQTELSTGSNQLLTAALNQSGTGGNQLPISLNLLPTNVKQVPASLNQLPSSISQLPSSGSQLPTNLNLLPTSVNLLPTSVNQLQISIAQLPTSQQQTGDVKVMPTTQILTIRNASNSSEIIQISADKLRQLGIKSLSQLPGFGGLPLGSTAQLSGSSAPLSTGQLSGFLGLPPSSGGQLSGGSGQFLSSSGQLLGSPGQLLDSSEQLQASLRQLTPSLNQPSSIVNKLPTSKPENPPNPLLSSLSTGKMMLNVGSTVGGNLPIQQTESKVVDDDFIDPTLSEEFYSEMIHEELVFLQNQLKQILIKNHLKNFDLNELIKENELIKIVESIDSIEKFLKEITDLTLVQSSELHQLKESLLQSFAWFEEANSRYKNSTNLAMSLIIKQQPLDPISEKQFNNIKYLCYYLESQLKQANNSLDEQWELFQDHCRKTIKIQIPTMEMIFLTLVKQNATITKQNYILKDISSKIRFNRTNNKSALAQSPLLVSLNNCKELEDELKRLRLEPNDIKQIQKERIENRMKLLTNQKINSLKKFLNPNRKIPNITAIKPKFTMNDLTMKQIHHKISPIKKNVSGLIGKKLNFEHSTPKTEVLKPKVLPPAPPPNTPAFTTTDLTFKFNEKNLQTNSNNSAFVSKTQSNLIKSPLQPIQVTFSSSDITTTDVPTQIFCTPINDLTNNNNKTLVTFSVANSGVTIKPVIATSTTNLTKTSETVGSSFLSNLLSSSTVIPTDSSNIPASNKSGFTFANTKSSLFTTPISNFSQIGTTAISTTSSATTTSTSTESSITTPISQSGGILATTFIPISSSNTSSPPQLFSSSTNTWLGKPLSPGFGTNSASTTTSTPLFGTLTTSASLQPFALNKSVTIVPVSSASKTTSTVSDSTTTISSSFVFTTLPQKDLFTNSTPLASQSNIFGGQTSVFTSIPSTTPQEVLNATSSTSSSPFGVVKTSTTTSQFGVITSGTATSPAGVATTIKTPQVSSITDASTTTNQQSSTSLTSTPSNLQFSTIKLGTTTPATTSTTAQISAQTSSILKIPTVSNQFGSTLTSTPSNQFGSTLTSTPSNQLNATTPTSTKIESNITSTPSTKSGAATPSTQFGSAVTSAQLVSTTPSGLAIASTQLGSTTPSTPFGSAVTSTQSSSTTPSTLFGSAIISTQLGSKNPTTQSSTTTPLTTSASTPFGSSTNPSTPLTASASTPFGSTNPSTPFGSSTSTTTQFGSNPTPFGATTTTITTTTATSNQFGSTAFGSTATAPVSATYPFGAASTPFSTAAPTQIGSTTITPFGSSTLTPTNQFGSTSVFGTPTTTTTTSSAFQSGGSLFGNTKTTTASIFDQAPTNSGFGSFGNPTTTSSSVFGGQTNFGSSSGSIFGNSNTTASTSSGSIFGNTTTTSFGSSSGGGTSIFGGASQSTPFGSGGTTTGSNAFGSTTSPASSFSFAAAAAATSNQSNRSGAASSGFGFGSLNVCSPNTQQSSFGQNLSNQNPFALNEKKSSTPFGGSGGDGKSLFGTPTTSASTAGSIFGGSNTGSAIFGGQSFGSTTSAPPSGFGSSTTSGGVQFGSGQSSGFGQSAFGSSSSSGGAFGTSSFQPGPFSGGSNTVGQSGFGSPTAAFQKPPTQSAGFGSSPTFGGSPAFGGAPSFGGVPAFGSAPTFGSPSKIFGSTSPATPSVFGASSNTAQNSTFGNLATQNTVGFGNLAQQAATPPSSAPQFSGSSSFSSWR